VRLRTIRAARNYPSVPLDLAERIARAIWQFHFRIPLAVFWMALLGGVLAAFFVGSGAILIPLVIAAGGTVGVLRRRHYRRTPNLVLVPRVETYGDTGRAKRVQDQVLNTLRSNLAPEEFALVRPVPITVGPTDTAFAHLLLKRLDALYVLYGRTEDRAEGGWSVLAGLIQETSENLIHIDWHTRDRTPGRRNRDALRELLTPTRRVEDVEHPLAFTSELEALVRGVVGQVFAILRNDEDARRLLEEAIQTSGDSPAHPIDELRVKLASVLRRTEGRTAALEMLRQRRQRDNASPELLRTLATHLGPYPGDFDDGAGRNPQERAEAIAALRDAMEHPADPLRTSTMYNLHSLLASPAPTAEENAESERLLDEIMAADRYYRDAWYVHKHKGATHWWRGIQCEENGNAAGARAEFRTSARWYSSAIRARPKLRVFYAEDGERRLWLRFPPSPVMLANARDAHYRCGQLRRSAYYARRFVRARQRRLKKGFRLLDADEWERAYAHFDFASVGEVDDAEITARVFRAVALRQFMDPQVAEVDWQATRATLPRSRILMATVRRDIDLPQGVPGNEPNDPDVVRQQLRDEGHL
jgi:hypothetical protein